MDAASIEYILFTSRGMVQRSRSTERICAKIWGVKLVKSFAILDHQRMRLNEARLTCIAVVAIGNP
jgi:hypothetical protein